MNHSVLFVDDEENILKSLKRLLRKQPFQQYYCSSGEEGLKILEKHAVSVIVSDMRMPGMSGVDFLQHAMKISPLSVKIILSGYSDISDIMKAINEGHIDSFLKKPWNDQSLIIRLNNSCSYYEKLVHEKELTKELEEKNQQLADINRSLEKKVQLRTLELKENNRILKMIVAGEPVSDILMESCRVLHNLLKLEKVHLLEVKTGKWYPRDESPPESVLHKQEIGKNILVEDYLCYQMEENKKLFGYLYLFPIRQLNNNTKRIIKDFGALIEMVLMQQHSLEKSDFLVNSIDSILGDLDASP